MKKKAVNERVAQFDEEQENLSLSRQLKLGYSLTSANMNNFKKHFRGVVATALDVQNEQNFKKACKEVKRKPAYNPKLS